MERKNTCLKRLSVTSVVLALALVGCAARPAAAQTCTSGNIVVDGGFEATDFDDFPDANPNWDEASNVFETPICSSADCGASTTALPRTGTFWVWFGGTDPGEADTASVAQTVTIPSGVTSANLNFYLWIGRVSSPFTDTLIVQVDGITQLTITEPSSAASGYTQRTVNMMPFANGAPHQIKFLYTHPTTNPADFSLDDVSLDVVCGAMMAKDSPGLFTASTRVFNLRNTNTPGVADVTFGYGGAGDIPIKGDWDGDGDDTPGVYRPSNSTFFLRNSNSPGPGEITVQFGGANPNFVPLAGDWNGDGIDSIGLYDKSNGSIFLKNANAPGGADFTFTFGAGGASVTPITGDWDGNGTDTVGLYNVTTGAFFLRNSNSTGTANVVFTFGAGNQGYVPIAGDWDNNNTDTIGIYNPAVGVFFLRNTNSNGSADLAFSFGGGNQTPLAGDWDNLP